MERPIFKKWGDRKRTDKWRWSQAAIDIQKDSTASNQVKKVNKEDLYQVTYYTNKIPNDSIVIDSLSNLRVESYYQLGLLYAEQFSRFNKAENKFINLLEKEPKEEIKLATFYQLVKIYKETKQKEISDLYKLLNQYPDSSFARLLQKQSSGEQPVSGYKSAFN